jgi:alpha-beta hydrolase superfamily lysophospholipase
MSQHHDDRLESMYRRFTWRILSNYVTPFEFERQRAAIADYEQWCPAWLELAGEHGARGDEAAAAGRRPTAADEYVRAALCCHWANFMFSHDPPTYRAAFDAMAGYMAKAAPLVDPPMDLVEVAFDGVAMPGYVRVPAARDGAPPPVALLLPGGDSTKEELYNLAEYLLARGLAIAAFDGPGQGAVSLERKMRPDYELAVRAMIDALEQRDDVDTGRLAAGGISYGGLFAMRTAAVDDRVRAVFAVSSWYSPAGRFATMEPLSATGQYQHLGEDPAAMMEAVTLAGVLDRVKVPILQLFGGDDPGSPPSQGERVAAEAGGPVTTVVIPEGVHVLNNVWPRARALVGDWVAETLGASSGTTPVPA